MSRRDAFPDPGPPKGRMDLERDRRGVHVRGRHGKGAASRPPLPGILLPRFPGGAVRPSGHPVRDDARSGGDGECDVVVGTCVVALRSAAMLGEGSVVRPLSILVRPRHGLRASQPVPHEAGVPVLRLSTGAMVETPGTAPGSKRIMSLAFITISGIPEFHHPNG